MITVTLQFDNYTDAEAALRRLDGSVTTPVKTKVTPPPVTSAPPPPPAATPPEPPAAITPEQVVQAMQDKSASLADGGAACMALITAMGVSGVGEMTPAQLSDVLTKVEAL